MASYETQVEGRTIVLEERIPPQPAENDGITVIPDEQRPMRSLSIKDLSARWGVSEQYLTQARDAGYLQSSHYTSHWEPIGSDGLAQQVYQARIEGSAIPIRRRLVLPEEVADRFWATPKGKARLLSGRCRREILNVAQGYQPHELHQVIITTEGAAWRGGSMPAQLVEMGKIVPEEERLAAKEAEARLMAELAQRDQTIDALQRTLQEQGSKMDHLLSQFSQMLHAGKGDESHDETLNATTEPDAKAALSEKMRTMAKLRFKKPGDSS